MTHYTIPVRSQVKLYAQRAAEGASRAEKDIHRWVFVNNLTPGVESTVRKWLYQRLDSFYCDLQVMYTPRIIGPALARTHIVLNNTPLPASSMARNDEAVEVDARGLTPRDAAKAIIKATGLNPHLSVRGWPFCLDDVDGVNDAEGGAA
nr:MAG TPA: hypothetical protein [Caudoviricetes sp.]